MNCVYILLCNSLLSHRTAFDLPQLQPFICTAAFTQASAILTAYIFKNVKIKAMKEIEIDFNKG